jgi:hypothetical protein
MAITAQAGAACKTTFREKQGLSLPIERRRPMKRDTEIKALTPQQIECVAGGTSISPESLAKARATIKGRDGTSPEGAAAFLWKALNGLVRL